MFPKKKIYLDYNATTPVDQTVVDAMLPYFTQMYGNASSDHFFGWGASEAVELAREQISKLLNSKPTEITFTSGATEAANLALFGFCESNKHKGNHLITCKTEHKAVLDSMKALESKGFRITYLEVDKQGNIDLDDMRNAICSETILVNLMFANNETGLIHPIKKIAKIVHENGSKLMSDVTQAVGKIPVDLKDLNIDIAIFSSHKIYGPKGVGALYINKKNQVKINPTSFGGGQEKGIRPGTLNVPGIVGFGKAAELASERNESEAKKLSALRNKFEENLNDIEGIQFNSQDQNRLPNTSNISFEGVDGNRLLRKLNNLAVSRGSACTSNTIQPSHVVKAMGLSDESALSTFRFSLGRNTTKEDIEIASEEIKNVVDDLRKVPA